MKLEVAVADISQSKKDLSIEVAADEVNAEFERTYEALSRTLKLPGFRPGRVPRGVVKQRFAKEVKDEVVGRLLPHALQHAIADRQLRVVGQPHIDEVSVNEGGTLKFKASVEVLPDFELKQYKGLNVTKRVRRITDEDVERVIKHWREESAEFVPVEDRPSEKGDFVSINLTGKYIDPPEEEDLKSEDVQIELGADSVQPEFDENLRGVKAGDVREFRVSYPEDFGAKGLAGKTLDFTTTVIAVRKKELPELDDNFAQEYGEYETIEQMREDVRKDLVKDADDRAEARMREELLEQILNAYEFDLPSSLVDRQATTRTQELAYLMMRNGVSPETLREIDWEERMKEARTQAERDVRAALVIAHIGEAEEIKISEEEINAEITRMADATGEPREQLVARLTKDEALSSIQNRLSYQKTLQAVASSAEITVEELTEKQDAV
ncbi:MAG: trigger factor [Acidobacteria bacterium]|nr:trigger factor [Acidobacteriota bacterium]